MNEGRQIIIIMGLAACIGTTSVAAGGRAKQDVKPPLSSAEAFPASGGIVDLMVTGPAARTLYDRLPGKGQKAERGAGLHKGDGRLRCTKLGSEYSCHVWLDVPRQALADPEIDDC